MKDIVGVDQKVLRSDRHTRIDALQKLQMNPIFEYQNPPPQNKTDRAYGRMYAFVRSKIGKLERISADILDPFIGRTRAARTLRDMCRRGELEKIESGIPGNPRNGGGKSAVYRARRS